MSNEDDPLLEEASALVRAQGYASISLLQRKLRIGYGRAAELAVMMEKMGIVGAPDPVTYWRMVIVKKVDKESLGG